MVFLKNNTQTDHTNTFKLRNIQCINRCVKVCRIFNIIIQHIDTLPKYGQKTLDVRRATWRISNEIWAFGQENAFWQENAKIKSFSTIFSLQTLFCYQCVELYNCYSAQACVISPMFSQLGLRPRRLRIKRHHARFRAIMVKYLAVQHSVSVPKIMKPVTIRLTS